MIVGVAVVVEEHASSARFFLSGQTRSVRWETRDYLWSRYGHVVLEIEEGQAALHSILEDMLTERSHCSNVATAVTDGLVDIADAHVVTGARADRLSAGIAPACPLSVGLQAWAVWEADLAPQASRPGLAASRPLASLSVGEGVSEQGIDGPVACIVVAAAGVAASR